MIRGIHILCLALCVIGLMLPTNGCGGRNSSSVKKFDCTQQVLKFLDIPGTPSITMRTTHCNDYIFKQDKMSKAIHLFVEEYAYEFDISEHEVWSILTGLEIEVSAIPKIVKNLFDINGKFVEESPVNGLALTPSKIWVEIKTGQIWSSSLAHELVHIVIWHQNGKVHGDPDHEGDKFSGWTEKHTKFIKRFNHQLFDKGI